MAVRKTLSSLFLFIFGCFLWSGCASNGESHAVDSGWVDLLDGNTLNGWVKRGGQDNFKVIDGCIVGTNYVGPGNGFLCTAKDYSNFELELDFFCPPNTNSGIQIRSQVKQRENRKDTVWGYQIEIDPSERSWTGGFYEELGRGWIASLEDKPEARAAFKANDWNHLRIVANGTHFQVWLNGIPTSDVEDGETATGFIGLQLHWPVVKQGAKPGTQVKWKNIRLKELP
jgi:hypothetical protein